MNLRTPDQIARAHRGITLIELTVVILVLLSLLAILFVGARAWKRGSDRAGCVVQIRQVQVGVRSFANLNGYLTDQDVAPRDLKSEVIGPGRFVETSPECPASGTYSFEGNKIPKLGKLFMKCSLGGDGHKLPKRKDW